MYLYLAFHITRLDSCASNSISNTVILPSPPIQLVDGLDVSHYYDTIPYSCQTTLCDHDHQVANMHVYIGKILMLSNY